MITLYQFPPAYDLPFSVSPFCAKLQAYFELSGIEYVLAASDPRKAPRGKTPYIDTEQGRLGDSGLIIEWCKANYGDPLDGHLSAAQHARGHLVRRTVEEHLYWALLHTRFADDAGWVHQRHAVRAALPAPLRPLVPRLVRRGILKGLYAQGLGRHDAAQVARAGTADLESCVAQLEPGGFLFGDAPSSYDCSLWAMALAVTATPTDNALTAAARAMPELTDYLARINMLLDAAA